MGVEMEIVGRILWTCHSSSTWICSPVWIPESPPASRRDPGPYWLMESRASSSLRSGFPRTHPVPTPESWRPARNARRPGGRLAKFRVPLQETESYVPGSGKPVSLGLRVACKSPPRRLGRLCRLNSCSVSLQF